MDNVYLSRKHFQFCKQRSFSDSDINSCEEFLSNKRPFSGYVSQDSRLASLASSEDSHYGSESAMELYNRAEQIHAGLSHDLISTIEMVEEEVDASIASDSFEPLHSSLGIGDRDQSKRSSDKSRSEIFRDFLTIIADLGRGSKKSRRTSSDNVSTPMSLRSRSSSLLSTTDENELEMIKEPETEKIKYDTKLDAVFDLVLDLRQQDLDQYKLFKSKKEETEVEPEPEKSPEEPRYRFKHPCGVKEVTVSNLGKQSDLEKVILPTKTLKIEETSEPVRQTRDIVPLIVKTTSSLLETDSVTLHIEEEDITDGQNTKNDDPEKKTNSSESNSVQSNVRDISKSSPGSVSKLNVNSSCPGTLTARKSTSSSGPVLGDKVSHNFQIRFC